MSRRVYISSDYSESDGDRDVVNVLSGWGYDNLHSVDFVDMARVVSGSVAKNNPDCRICDLKAEFNKQINLSSVVIFVVGDKTADREAGNTCKRANREQYDCFCTPYKQNTNGQKSCKVYATHPVGKDDDFENINSCSYLQHEFEQAIKKSKKIIILYNSTQHQTNWLPEYMKAYQNAAHPFWKYDYLGRKVGDYQFIKEELERE